MRAGARLARSYLPASGLSADWGYDQFYQDWQEQMARFAAACKGVKWIK